MAEPQIYKFSYTELAELMTRHVGVSDGLWGIYVRFGIQAANAGSGPEDLRPTAIVPILEIGLQQMKEKSSLTVDASSFKRPKRKPSRKTPKQKAS